MTTYRTYSAVDVVNGESTLSAHRKQNTRFADVQSWFPVTSGAAQHQAMLLGSGLTSFVFTHVLRSDAVISLTGVASLTAGDMLYFDGTNLVEISVGTSGQTLKLSGTTPTWTTTGALDDWVNKTTNFTSADGGRYQCSSGVTSIALHSPAAGDEFYIKASIGNSFITTSVAFTGTPQIAGAASTAYTLNEDVIYHFVSNGTDYDVSGEVIER